MVIVPDSSCYKKRKGAHPLNGAQTGISLAAYLLGSEHQPRTIGAARCSSVLSAG